MHLMLGMKILIGFFINLSLKHCDYDHNICVLHVDGETLILALYIDDLVITRNNVNLILGLKKQLIETFEMIDLSLLHFLSWHSNFTKR